MNDSFINDWNLFAIFHLEFLHLYIGAIIL